MAYQMVKTLYADVTSARLALDLAERAGDEQGQAYALTVPGDALDSSGQYNESIEANEKRIAIAEKLKDSSFHGQEYWNKKSTLYFVEARRTGVAQRTDSYRQTVLQCLVWMWALGV
jgi:hypothetical protein